MATKRELKDRASALATQLGVDVQTDRLNHEALTALVVELEAKAAGPTAEPESAPVEPPACVPEPEPAPEPDAPVVEAAATPTPESASEPSAAVLAIRERGAARKAAKRYVVAPGRSLFCARAGGAGLQAGSPIRPTDFSDERLQQLIEAGAVVEA
jgi:hypothetical protein